MSIYNQHVFLTPAFLTRSPGNFCLRCGRRMNNVPKTNFNFVQVKKKVIGYVHKEYCLDKPDGDLENVK